MKLDRIFRTPMRQRKVVVFGYESAMISNPPLRGGLEFLHFSLSPGGPGGEGGESAAPGRAS